MLPRTKLPPGRPEACEGLLQTTIQIKSLAWEVPGFGDRQKLEGCTRETALSSQGGAGQRTSQTSSVTPRLGLSTGTPGHLPGAQLGTMGRNWQRGQRA